MNQMENKKNMNKNNNNNNNNNNSSNSLVFGRWPQTKIPGSGIRSHDLPTQILTLSLSAGAAVDSSSKP